MKKKPHRTIIGVMALTIAVIGIVSSMAFFYGFTLEHQATIWQFRTLRVIAWTCLLLLLVSVFLVRKLSAIPVAFVVLLFLMSINSSSMGGGTLSNYYQTYESGFPLRFFTFTKLTGGEDVNGEWIPHYENRVEFVWHKSIPTILICAGIGYVLYRGKNSINIGRAKE